ncbi:hypothetical protein TWF730_002037 [Orbilia blumenaviensis]|uniref:Uncharacterized protein n=1 Tax=Orbilia blumenaviensis TaxID=1796055 RepID=A0AAV9UCT2_9PEZI
MSDDQGGSGSSDRPLMDTWREEKETKAGKRQDKSTSGQDFIQLPYPVQHGVEFLRLVAKLKPFAPIDCFIRRIRWDMVSDSLHRKGIFHEQDGRALEAGMKYMLYKWDDNFSMMCECKIKAPYVRERIKPTVKQIREFKSLLKVILKEWDVFEQKREIGKLGYSQIEHLNHGKAAYATAAARKSLSIMRSEGLKRLHPTPVYAEDLVLNKEIPAQVNDIRIDFLYHLRYKKGCRPRWLTFLERSGIVTIGDIGGWGPNTTYPYAFHRRLIEALNKHELFKDNMDIKETIGNIGWTDIESILTDQLPGAFQAKTEQPRSQKNAAPKHIKHTKPDSLKCLNHVDSIRASAPKVRPANPNPTSRKPAQPRPQYPDDMSIEDIWSQVLRRTPSKPEWLLKLNENNINTIGDLGGWDWKDRATKLQQNIKDVLRIDPQTEWNASWESEINSLSYNDLKNALAEWKQSSSQDDLQGREKVTIPNGAQNRKRKSRVEKLDNSTPSTQLQLSDSDDEGGPGEVEGGSQPPSLPNPTRLRRGGSKWRKCRSEAGIYRGFKTSGNNETIPEPDEGPVSKVRKLQVTDILHSTLNTDTRMALTTATILPSQVTDDPKPSPTGDSLQNAQTLESTGQRLDPPIVKDSFESGFFSDYRAIRNLSYLNRKELCQLKESMESGHEELRNNFDGRLHGIEDRLEQILQLVDRPNKQGESGPRGHQGKE